MADIQFPIEPGHIMAFARAIGDSDPAYYAAERAGPLEGPLYAPPTFMQSSAQFDPDYPLRPKIGEPWFGSGKEATGKPAHAGGAPRSGQGVQLHAEQHFEYFRHPEAGEHLTVTSHVGESWTKQSKRSGTLAFSELISEYRDRDGKLVVRARLVSVRPDASDES